jgi:hypothetical protein
MSSSSYVPPAIRNRLDPTPKKLTFRPPVDFTVLKTKDQLFKEYQTKNLGKADSAWADDQE